MSIYHLHIPRTSGIFVKYSIVPGLLAKKKKVFASNRSILELEYLKDCDFVTGHFSNTPIPYMDNPKVYCIVREPVERWISYFKYTTGIKKTNEDIAEKMNDWLYGEQSEVQANLQSKFLTGSLNVEEFNLHHSSMIHKVRNGWFVQNFSLDPQVIKEHVDNINCFSLDNQTNFIKSINNELNNQFQITAFNHTHKVNESRNIDLKLTSTMINRIKELNQIDMEIYQYVKEKEQLLDN